jgi:hypothetical protein
MARTVAAVVPFGVEQFRTRLRIVVDALFGGSQSACARAVQMQKVSLGRLFKNAAAPSMKTIQQLAAHLNIPAGYFWGGLDARPFLLGNDRDQRVWLVHQYWGTQVRVLCRTKGCMPPHETIPAGVQELLSAEQWRQIYLADLALVTAAYMPTGPLP